MSFEDLLRNHQSINALARSLIGRPAFDEINVLIPDSRRPEPGFIRATSWLYCLYFEGGRVSIVFLVELGVARGLIERDRVETHREAVRCLRTELNHNLGFADSDQQARTAAELWRRKACGTALPESDDHWADCYNQLLDEAIGFLRGMEDVVRQLETSGDDASDCLDDWKRWLNRSFPASDFDPLVEDAKSRFGRSALNTVAFRNRHVDRWRKQLELLDDGFDFERESTLLIEKTMLDDDSAVLPITGGEIMRELGLNPGPVVGRLLEEARRRFMSAPCGAEELIDHLRTFHEGPAAAEI